MAISTRHSTLFLQLITNKSFTVKNSVVLEPDAVRHCPDQGSDEGQILATWILPERQRIG
jgi:hypothetical protein